MEPADASYPSLKGRPVLITGGASGIGESIVEHFAAQGARVTFLDVQRDAGEALADRIRARGIDRPLFLPCNLTAIDELKAAIATSADRHGPPLVLVNNAGNDDRHKVEDVTPEYWQNRMDTNLRHQFFCAQALKPDMVAAGGGSIINMSSTSFLMGQGGMAAYTAAKSGVIGLTRSLARDLGPHHIRANIVFPGWIVTQRQLDLWMTPEAEAKRAQGQCIPDRLYEADVARMVLWLAADDSRMATGRDFIVDGGWF